MIVCKFGFKKIIKIIMVNNVEINGKLNKINIIDMMNQLLLIQPIKANIK